MIDAPAKQPDTPQDDAPAYSHRKIWWIVGGTLTAAVLLFAMAGAGLWIWAASSPREESNHTEEYAAVAMATADVEIGDIVLEGVSGTMIEAETHLEWRGAQPEADRGIIGDVFYANGDCDEGLFMLGGIDDCRIDYTLGLPSGVEGGATTSVGDIRLEGLDGDVKAEASVGDVEGVDLRTTDLEVEASVGSVELEFDQVLGDIDVTADTGDVLIEVPDDGTTYAVRFDSGVGGQHIDIATDPEATADRVITVTSGVGSLTVRYAA
jgi:hypothetical protein